MTQLKSLAHPDWPYTGTPWEWRVVAKSTEQPNLSMSMFLSKKDLEEARATYQRLNFGPDLP